MRYILLVLAVLATGCGDGGTGEATPPPNWCTPTPEEIACAEKGDGWRMLLIDGEASCQPPLGLADPESPNKCVARGGEAVFFVDAYWGCIEKTADAGCACTDVSECIGYCEPPEGAKEGEKVIGACSTRTMEVCFRMVSGGIVTGELCM